MNSTPPKISASNAGLVAGILAAAALGIAALVYFFNPSAHGFYPV